MPKKIVAEIGYNSFDQTNRYVITEQLWVRSFVCFFLFCDCKLEQFGVCTIPLETYFEDLSNGILHTPKCINF